LATCDGMERVDELNANIKGFWLNGLRDESGLLLLVNTLQSVGSGSGVLRGQTCVAESLLLELFLATKIYRRSTHIRCLVGRSSYRIDVHG